MKYVVRTAVVAVALGSLFSIGCSSEDGGTNPPGAGSGGRGGSGPAGTAGAGGTGGTGGGAPGSGGTGGGAGRAPDAGRRPDAGRAPDAGRRPDAGVTPDGRRPDAGAAADTGNAAPPRTAVADIMSLNGSGSMITGRVTFTEVTGGVQMAYALENCPPGPNLTHIHLGTTCQNFTTHWNRGEGIGGNERITCGADGRGTLVYTRMNTPANLGWTIGGAMASNLEGRPVIIHVGTSTTAFQGCGIVRLTGAANP